MGEQAGQGVEPTSPRSLTSAAYLRLRDEIMRGNLAPGTKLHIRQLCDRLGHGLSPVREALNRLASEGLVVHSDQRGFTVAGLDLEDLADLTAARVQLNAVALQAAIERGDAEWEEKLLLSYHRLTRTPRHLPSDQGRNPAWELAHRAFHSALIASCGSRRIRDICEQLFDAADRYRYVARIAVSDQRPDDAEHRAIMEAALAREVETAVRLLTAHVLETEELVRRKLFAAAGAAEQDFPAARDIG